MSSYVHEIASIDLELKRLRGVIKELTAQRARATTHLHQYMIRNQLEEVGGIKATKVAPKPKVIRRKPKEKKEDAIRLFMEIGINDPETFWDDFQRTQKPIKEPEGQPEEECVY